MFKIISKSLVVSAGCLQARCS